MRLALVIDRDQVAHEHDMLLRYTSDLTSAGIEVLRVLPAGTAVRPRADTDEDDLVVDMGGLPWARAARRAGLAEDLRRREPDALHALGPEGWRMALALGRRLDLPVIVEVWSARHMRSLPRGRAVAGIAAYVARTPALATALRQQVEPELVSCVLPGAPITPRPGPVLVDPQREVSLAIVGGGRDLPAYRGVLTALSRLTRTWPQIQAFLELRGPAAHEIWRCAAHLELLDHVSAHARADRIRGLLTQCDVLVLPERLGDLHSILLEGMAAAMPIVAGQDAMIDLLDDGVEAMLVDAAEDAGAWARQLESLLGQPDMARALGAAARERVRHRHDPSTQASALARILHRAVAGDAMAFEAGPRPDGSA